MKSKKHMSGDENLQKFIIMDLIFLPDTGAPVTATGAPVLVSVPATGAPVIVQIAGVETRRGKDVQVYRPAYVEAYDDTRDQYKVKWQKTAGREWVDAESVVEVIEIQ